MNLGVTRIGKEGASFVRSIGCGDIATACISRKIKHVAITTSREDHGVTSVCRDFTGDEIADNNPFGVALHDDNVQQLHPRKHLHSTKCDLPSQGLVGTKQHLLAGLAS